MCVYVCVCVHVCVCMCVWPLGGNTFSRHSSSVPTINFSPQFNIISHKGGVGWGCDKVSVV